MDLNVDLTDKMNNPYVKDPFYFQKHPQNSSIFSSKSWVAWNYHLSGAIGSFFNLLLIYLIIFRTPTHLKPYGRMLLLCCCSDIFYILINAACQTRAKMNDGCLIFVLDGVASNLNYKMQTFMVCLLCGGMSICCTILPAQFYYRYCLMARNLTLSLKQTLLCGCVSLFFTMTLVFLAFPSYSYSGLSRADFDYSQLWYPETPVPKLVFSDVRSGLTFIYIAYAVVLCSMSYVITMLLFWLTLREINMNKTEVEISTRTQKLQTQFNKALMLQATVPLLSVVLPIAIAGLTTLLRLDTGVLGIILINIVCWLPVLNSMATLLFIPSYRNLVIRFITRRKFNIDNTVQHASNLSISRDLAKIYRPSDRCNDQRDQINNPALKTRAKSIPA